MGSYLAFDLGASSGRAMIGTLKNGTLTLREVHRFTNGPTKCGDSIFWDFPRLTGELKTGLKKALEIEPELAGIGLDTWGVDYVLFDRATGLPRRWPYHYRDSRTDQISPEVWKCVSREELYRITGIQYMPINTVYQLAAHKKNHPEDFENSFLLPISDALIYSLGGKPTSEYTESSTSNLLDAGSGQWDWRIIDALGLPREIFTKIVRPCSYGGSLSEALQRELNAPPVPIIKVGSHDTASAVAAVPGNGTWAYLCTGTWALLGAELDRPCRSAASEQANFTNEGGLEGKIRFLSNIMGSWLLQETRRVWNENGEEISFAAMEELARNAESCRFLINPNWPEFAAPGDMPRRIIEFCERTGQGKITEKSEIVRAIYDSLALYFRLKLQGLSRILDTGYQALNIVGGGVKDELLMQLTADALSLPVIAGPIEATATGNLLAQAITTGELANLAEARQVVKNSFPVATFRPDPNGYNRYRQQLERFEKLVEQKI